MTLSIALTSLLTIGGGSHAVVCHARPGLTCSSAWLHGSQQWTWNAGHFGMSSIISRCQFKSLVHVGALTPYSLMMTSTNNTLCSSTNICLPLLNQLTAVINDSIPHPVAQLILIDSHTMTLPHPIHTVDRLDNINCFLINDGGLCCCEHAFDESSFTIKTFAGPAPGSNSPLNSRAIGIATFQARSQYQTGRTKPTWIQPASLLGALAQSGPFATPCALGQVLEVLPYILALCIDSLSLT